MKNKARYIIGVDPGDKGAFAIFDGKLWEFHPMPMENGSIDFDGIHELLDQYPFAHVFVERAIPFAQGAKAAFTYGMGFAKIICALEFLACNEISYTLVEPGKWAKEMHQGISADLKPKVKSVIAAERLFPKVFKKIPKSPKSKKPHEGYIDALLIAAWAIRTQGAPEVQKRSKARLSDF